MIKRDVVHAKCLFAHTPSLPSIYSIDRMKVRLDDLNVDAVSLWC